ncbi:hypothetical protein [Psychromicrobium lacuslunae]|uniref:Uncharacterized protein n=1 Tax=Psychromicrobium lacuslunae TaxID=1618207 RepID=A0A0D4BXY5_9MICC|nr:hypothetical protein [Psychromicrobium lacuslunae]AJT41183.1 hypothetical protein UM93_06025 [Psychromicrobium lacuslunae]
MEIIGTVRKDNETQDITAEGADYEAARAALDAATRGMDAHRHQCRPHPLKTACRLLEYSHTW